MVTNLIRQYVPDDAPVPTDPIFISTRGMVGPSTQPTAAKQTVALPSNILEHRPLVENEPPTKITKKTTNCPVKNPVTRTATVTRPVVENNTTHLPINATNTVSLSASSDEGTTPTVGAEASSRYDWGERETRFLIQLITDNWKKLELAYNKKPIWLDISVKLNETMATKLTQDQCREKWNTLKKTYKSYKRQCSLTGNRKPRPFLFESDLDDLMLNDPSITPVLTMGSNTGVIDGEDITTNNTTERESTSSANKSTKKSCKRAKKSDVEDLKEYFEERDKKFMNTLEKMFEKNTEVMEKLVDKL
ncbi:Hypothetical predicted protein [Mytilus galloprovincialis]|uniref:Myb-like domain-containing protein n=1 Tax=Mytilus galloprovincialis TaxID=29158 RepID=A0A8B6CGI8_MYTGA|nr:Hypothetical predicted protein [Mytilus galloprovincialis]